MSDEQSAEERPAQAAAPSPKKPPTALVVAGLAVTTLIVGVALLRGRAPTPSSQPEAPRSAPSAPEREGGVAEAPDPMPPENSQSLADTVGPANAEVLAIFAPLRVGSAAGPGRIEQISDVVDGRVMLSVRQGNALQVYGVMLHSEAAAGMRRAGPYVLYVHGMPRPEFHTVADAIVAAIQANVRRGVRTLSDLRPFARDEPRN